MIEDYELIVSSMRKEYGVSPREYGDITFQEFKALLTGMGPNTALGRVVGIRSETDQETIREFSKDQLRIYSKWQNRMAKNVEKQELDTFLDSMLSMFTRMGKEE